MWVYFWAVFSGPLIDVSVFVLVPYCFDYCSFVGSFESREHDTSSFVLFSQNCFDYCRIFCVSIHILGLFVLVLWRMPLFVGVFWVFFVCLFVFCCMAYGILVPQPGIESMLPAVVVWSLNHRRSPTIGILVSIVLNL